MPQALLDPVWGLLSSAPTMAASILDPEALLERFGTWAFIAVLVIIFAECGLLIGFFLPGDSLLFVAGMLTAEGFIDQPIWLVATSLCIVAILGNVVGYWVGAMVGPRLFQREDSRLFRREYVDRTAAFFDRYGRMAIVLARFVPIVRTFITAIAGVANMDFRTYLTYSAIGGVIWGGGVTTLGYFLGTIPLVRDNIEVFLIGFVLLSTVPILIEGLRHRARSRRS